MTTENTGSPHDPDYNISVSSAPDRIPEGYVPPEGSPASETYDPNAWYPDATHDRAMDTADGTPDEKYLYPDAPPDMTQDMLDKILSKTADMYYRFGQLEEKFNEMEATVKQQTENIEQLVRIIEKSLMKDG